MSTATAGVTKTVMEFSTTVLTLTVPGPENDCCVATWHDYDDFIIGRPSYDGSLTDAGAAYVFHGKREPCATNPPESKSILGDQTHAQLGYSVAGAGDINGDGYDDIVVGQPYFDERAPDPDINDVGRALVYLGSATGVASGPSWEEQGNTADTEFGTSVAGAGDVNGDGWDDVIIGAPGYDGDKTDEGKAYVFSSNVTAEELLKWLGMDPSLLTAFNEWFVTDGDFIRLANSETPGAVGPGPYPESIVLSTGLAEDQGHGDTDWSNDGQEELTFFQSALHVPPWAKSLRFTTQLISREFIERGACDTAWFYFYKSPSQDYCQAGINEGNACTTNDDCPESYCRVRIIRMDPEITSKCSGEINPAVSYGINVEGLNYITPTFNIQDNFDGRYDTSFIISNMYFSSEPLPDDITSCLGEPDCEGMDGDGDGVVDYFGNPSPSDVSLTTGTYTYTKELLNVPGIGMPFNLSMIYNSGSFSSSSLGRRWSHSYEGYVQKIMSDQDEDGTPETLDFLLVRHGSGAAEYFEPDGAGGYKPKYGGTYSTLTESGGEFSLVTKSHLTYLFNEPLDPDDPEGKVTLLNTVTDANGNSFELFYDTTTKKLDHIIDTRGEQFNFIYDADGYLSKVEYPAGGTPVPSVSFSVNSDTGNLTSFANLNGDTTTFTYDANGYLLTGEDIMGRFVSNVYEQYQGVGSGQTGYRVAKQGDPNSPDPQTGISMTYDGESMTRTDRLDRNETRVFDVKGRLSRRVDAMGAETTYTYDADNRTKSVTNPAGTVAAMAYDANGNLAASNEAAAVCAGGAKSGQLCASDADCPDSTCGAVCVGGPNITQACSSDIECPGSSCGARQSMTYDDGSNLLTQSDHLGNATTFTYGPGNNNLLSQEDPLGHQTTYTYDTHGQMESKTGPRGNDPGDPVFGAHFEYTYNALGYLEDVIDPLENITSHTYDKLGRRTSTTDARLNTTSFIYDNLGQLTSFTNPLNEITEFTYDTRGNLLTLQENNNATFSYEYTPTGKIKRIIDPLTHSFSYAYDAEDRRVSHTDAINRVTRYEYDDTDRLIKVIDPELGEAGATYDEVGNRTSLTDPNGNTTTYGYDLLGRVTEEIDPLSRQVKSTYDGRGLITSRTNARGETLDNTYDLAGRLTNIVFGNGDSFHYTLDATGNQKSSEVTCVSDTCYKSVSRTFDSMDRLRTRSDDFGNTIEYVYDPAGNVQTITYSEGQTVTYSYDALNRLENVCDWNCEASQCNMATGALSDCTARYVYDNVGNLVQAILADGSTSTYTYDAAHRLTGISEVGPGGTIFAATYTLNDADERTAAELTLPLVPDLTPSSSQFTYNDANELVSRNGHPYSYDQDGNITSGRIGGAEQSMTYDQLNRLVQVDSNAIRYDADGFRVYAEISGEARVYVYDVTGERPRLLEEQDENGTVLARYVHGLGLISREASNGDLSVYHFDSRGSTVALTDENGAITDKYAYDPYGKVAGREGATPNPFTYSGRDGVFDDGNGLYFMRTRYYAPELMRFVQKDQGFDGTLELTQSLNRYVFVQGNPIQFVDPDGEWREEAAIGLYVAGIVAIIVVGTVFAGVTGIGLILSAIAIGVGWGISKLLNIPGVEQILLNRWMVVSNL